MKPCAKNLKALSCLAIGELDANEAEAMREHVAACAGCRRYLEEIKCVAGKISEASGVETGLEASVAFHRKLTRRIEEESPSGLRAALRRWLSIGEWKWSVAVPLAALVAVVLLFVPWQRQQHSSPPLVASLPTVAAKPGKQIAPTLGDYLMLANQSTDALDNELTREANESYAKDPVYKMSGLALTIPAD
jgi:hypothetical protein